jgi:O-antigen ligase
LTVIAPAFRRVHLGPLAWVAAAAVFAPIEGGLIALKPALAIGIPLILLALLAAELPVIAILALTLALRVVTDDTSGSASRSSGSVNLSGVIAGVLLVIALGLLVRNQRALRPIAAVIAFIVIWTLVAVYNHGPSLTILREGIRELSVLAVAVIVIESPRALVLTKAARLAQLAGLAPALVVFYQLATHHGMQVHANLRPNGTFSQPNSAGVFFAVAGLASIWLYFEHGRRMPDLLAGLGFAAATIGTYSIGGVATFLVMLLALGTVRRGRVGVRVAAWALAGIAVIVFVLTPVGASRLQTESNISTANGRDTSLTWRFSNWGTLLPLYEKSIVVGQGLGVTVVGDTTKGALPHSEWVRYLVETGTAGMVIIVLGIVMLMRRLWRLRQPYPESAPFAIALILGLLFNCLGANTLLYTPAAYAAAMLLGATWRTIHTAGEGVTESAR